MTSLERNYFDNKMSARLHGLGARFCAPQGFCRSALHRVSVEDFASRATKKTLILRLQNNFRPDLDPICFKILTFVLYLSKAQKICLVNYKQTV